MHSSAISGEKSVGASIPLRANILACDEVKSPFILGIIKPLIYIPSSMAEPTLDYVITHETAHIMRRDYWWKPFGFFLLTVHWFNPLCWLAYVLLCRDIEMACDEKVIRDMDKGSIAEYSQALLDCSFPRRRIAACPLAFGEVGVKERVKSVLNHKKPAFWIIVIAVVACVAVAVCFLTNPKLTLSDKRMIRQSYASAYACAVANQVEIEKDNAEVIRNQETIELVFPVSGGEQQIRVTNTLKDGKIDSQSTVIEDKYNLLAFVATKWFDALHGDEMKWDGIREINLDEFPDVTFRWHSDKLEAVSDKEIIPLYTGMPIWSVYFCDLTGDGKPELCSTLSIGSGRIDMQTGQKTAASILDHSIVI